MPGPVIFQGDYAGLLPSKGIQFKDGTQVQTGTVNPSVSATDGFAGSIYINTVTGLMYQKTDSGSSTNWIALTRNVAQVVTVAKSGGDFTSIQSAINSIVDAGPAKPYIVKVFSGIYTENVIIKDDIYLVGTPGGAVQLTGNISGTLTRIAGIEGLRINFTSTADGQSAVNITGGSLYFKNNSVVLLGADNWAVTGCSFSSGVGYTIAESTVVNSMTFAGITKDFTGWLFAGSGAYGIISINTSDKVNAASGTRCLFKVTSTGTYTQSGGTGIFTGSGPFTGTVHGICVATAASSPSIFRATSSLVIRLSSASGGTGVGLLLDSSVNFAEFQHVNTTVFITGFTANQEYSAFTNTSDVQKVWFTATNKNLLKGGTGLSIITPYDQNTTGFVEWGAGVNYWSFTPGINSFTVIRGGVGVVRSAPVTWAMGQSVTLTDLAVNYVYVTSTGTIAATTSTNSGALYLDNIVLFEVWVQGSNFIVTKENHPWEFTSAVSRSWHNLFGSLLENATQTLTIANAASRTVNLGGTNTLNDHGITTSVTAQSPVTWIQVVTGTSGFMYQIGNQSGIISRKSDPANTTGTLVANGRHVIYRLGVIKDNLNTSNPIFICHADTTDYSNLSSANNAIAAGTVAAFPPEVRALECCQLGFAIVQANGAEAGTLVGVTPAFQVFGAQFVAGGTSTSGSLITLNPSNFGGQLSGSETNVQAAFDRIDDHGYVPAYVAGVSYRVGNVIAQDQCIYRCVSAVASSTIWATDKGSFEQISTAKEATLAAIKAATANDGDFAYCAETETLYRYEVDGADFVADDRFYLTTATGGNTRWVSFAGKFVAGPSYDPTYLSQRDVVSNYGTPVAYPIPRVFNGTIRTASDEATLTAAIAASATGDIVQLTANITVTATVVINKTIKLDGAFSIIHSGAALVTLISVTANDVYITSAVTIKQQKSVNSSNDTAVAVNATGFVSNATVEFNEIGYSIRGSFSIGGKTKYATGANTNSHRHIICYSLTGNSQVNGIIYDSIAPPTPTGTQYDNFYYQTGAGGGDVFDYTLKIANCRPVTPTQSMRQFYFQDYFTKTGGAVPNLIIENNFFNDLNGGVGMFAPAGVSPLDFFGYVAVVNNYQGPLSDVNNTFKGLLYLDSAGGVARPIGNCVLYFAGNRHATRLRSANDYTSAIDYGGVAYKSVDTGTAYFTNPVPLAVSTGNQVDGAIYNYLKEFITNTTYSQQQGQLPAWVSATYYLPNFLVLKDNAVWRCDVANADVTFTYANWTQLTIPSYADVATAEAIGGEDSILCYVISTNTFYQYVSSGGAYTRDGTYVLNTATAGNTRRLGVSGRYDINLKSDLYVENSVNNGIITTAGETTLKAVTTRLSAFSSLSEWTTGLVYRVGNMVRFSGAIYRCNTLHTASAAFATDIDKWDSVGSASTSRTSVTQVNTFTAGQPVYLSGATYALAKADTAATAEAVGIVESSTGTAFSVVTGGRITGLTGLVAGTVYFVSDATAGLLTAVEPTTIGNISKPVLIADSTTSGFVVNMRGAVVGSANAKSIVAIAASQANAVLFDLSPYKAGVITGWIETNAPLREHFTMPFCKKGDGSYGLGGTVAGDLSGVSFDAVGNNLVYTSTAIATPATFTYSLDASAVGATFPLAINGTLVQEQKTVTTVAGGGSIPSGATTTVYLTTGTTATLAQAPATDGILIRIKNIHTATCVVSVTTSTVDGVGTSFNLLTNEFVTLMTYGGNYLVMG